MCVCVCVCVYLAKIWNKNLWNEKRNTIEK